MSNSGWNRRQFFAAGTLAASRPERIPELESPPHMKNWLECLRTRKEPAAPIEAGYQHAVACLMGDLSWVTGRRMTYDPAKRTVQAG